MARGGRCTACDEKLEGAARFCAACGAPAGTAGLDVTPAGDDTELLVPGAPLVRDRSRWLLPAGLVAIGALVALLALNRLDGDSSAAEPPPTTSPPTTTTTSPTTTTTATTTTSAPTTTVAPGFVDVSEVPDELTDTTLILVQQLGSVGALDLDTGELTTLETEVLFASDSQLSTTPVGIVQQRWTADAPVATVVSWSLEEVAVFDSGEIGAMRSTAGGDLWTVAYDGEATLSLMTADGSLVPVRPLDGWASLVGTMDGDALVASGWTGGTHRVATDGTTELVVADMTLAGGRDWVLAVDCDEALDCSARLVDLASGRQEIVELPGGGDRLFQEALSWDGRRGLLLSWAIDGPDNLVVVDADQMTVTTTETSSTRRFGPGQGGYDHDLRYVFRPVGGVTITDLDSGEEIGIETEGPVREVIVAPPGWEPPAEAG